MIQVNKNFNTLAQKLVNLEKNQGKEEEIKQYAAKYFWKQNVIDMAINYCKNNLQ